MVGKRELCAECGTNQISRARRADAAAARKLRVCMACYEEKARTGKEGVAVAAEVFAKARAESGKTDVMEEVERFEERFLATMMWILVGEKPEKIVRRLRGAADYVERAFVKKGARR